MRRFGRRALALALTLTAVVQGFGAPVSASVLIEQPGLTNAPGTPLPPQIKTDPRFLAMAKTTCDLPDTERSVDVALARLASAHEAPSKHDLAIASQAALSSSQEPDPDAAPVEVTAGSETYAIVADSGVGEPGRGFGEAGPIAAVAPPDGTPVMAHAAEVSGPFTLGLVPPDPSPTTNDPSTGATGGLVPGDATTASPDPNAPTSQSSSASPSGSASPSTPPTPQIPPALPGPASLVEPTPRTTSAASPSPPPIPTYAPAAVDTGPVILDNPDTPPSFAPAGPTGAPFYAPTPRPPLQPTPSPKPTKQPHPLGTLAPNQMAILADRGDGSTHEHEPGDYDGNVHVFYATGQIVGDHAHYDGDHTVSITGHAYLINRAQDAILYADLIEFDTNTHKALLVQGTGETTQGVDVGKLHYHAERIQSKGDGATHADRATFTTCDKPHSGYHVNAKTIDVIPGDKLVARHATIFLGALAIFYIPLLVIPLRDIKDPRRQTQFLPIFGYSKTEGAYVMARLAFDEGPTYYGYYRVDYYTKRGLGLGYDAFIGTRNNRRQATIDGYTISDRITDTRQTNVTATEIENFSRTVRSQIGVNYTGDFGAGVEGVPASLNINGSIIHTGKVSTENFTFSRFVQGSLSDNYNLALIDTLNLGPSLTQQFNLSYSKYNSKIAGSDTFHINTLTHYFTKLADLNLKYDKTDFSAEPFGYDSVPELQVMPHIPFGSFRFPFTTQLTVGEYTEPQNHFSTQRVQGVLNYPLFLQLGQSSFSGAVNVTQDYYGTGDEKGFITQNAAFSTPFGNHVVNSITYNEQNPLGPADVPFQLLDRLSGGSHSGQDVLRIFNGNVYSIQLADGTNFDHQAQSINYQISLRPSPRSLLLLGGYYQPGPGQGFNTTNVQGVAPLGPYTDIEYTTNVDYKNKFRLEDKNLYLTKIIDCCYRLQASYNQDLKQFNLAANLLAFPSQGIGIGSGQSNNSILPQSFAF